MASVSATCVRITPLCLFCKEKSLLASTSRPAAALHGPPRKPRKRTVEHAECRLFIATRCLRTQNTAFVQFLELVRNHLGALTRHNGNNLWEKNTNFCASSVSVYFWSVSTVCVHRTWVSGNTQAEHRSRPGMPWRDKTRGEGLAPLPLSYRGREQKEDSQGGGGGGYRS